MVAETTWNTTSLPDIDIHEAIKTAIDGGYAISPSENGKLLGSLILLRERDAAVGPPDQCGRLKADRSCSLIKFMEELFGEDVEGEVFSATGINMHKGNSPTGTSDTFKGRFAESEVFFTHFVKFGQQNTLSDHHVAVLMH